MSKPWDNLLARGGRLESGIFKTTESDAFIEVEFEPQGEKFPSAGLVLEISRQVMTPHDCRELAAFLLIAADQLEPPQ